MTAIGLRDEGSLSARLARTMLESLAATSALPDRADLCLVREPADFDDAPLPADVVMPGGRRWRLARVDGDFGLRVALVDAAGMPLLALTTRTEAAFQADLSERAVKRRVLVPRARHLLRALTGIDASALDDDRFDAPLRDVLHHRRTELLGAIRERTWGSLVRDVDAAAVLCAAAFGADDRYVEDRPGLLWASWLERPPLHTESTVVLAREIIYRRYPAYARVLDPALGATAAEAFRTVARHAFGDGASPGERTASDRIVLQLAVDTARRLRERGGDAILETLVAAAEAAYVAAGSPDRAAPLLRSALLSSTRALARRMRGEMPPVTAEIAPLAQNVYADRSVITALERIARLARGLRALGIPEHAFGLRDFANTYRDEVAWLDRAARRVREIASLDEEIVAAREDLVSRWFALRDTWNERFAETLAQRWSSLFAQPGIGGPFVVSHILKYEVRPKLETHKTFLVVLDGCDVATFLEVLDAFGAAGIAPAKVDVALSAIPTVTSHARRSIFGGSIPFDHPPEDDRAADATADKKAFEGPNQFLGTIARKLFLKGDLGDGGTALVAALEADPPTARVLAAVFNDVDDAIASKEHGVLAERTLERCTEALRRALVAAFETGWRIIVTADHGNTPYRQPDVKTQTSHARYSPLGAHDAPPAKTVQFEKGVGMPYRLAALWQMGAHAGPQHIGYHGGVSLEEMFVPLAIFDRNATPASPAAPAWWDDVATTVPAAATIALTNELPGEAIAPFVAPPPPMLAAVPTAVIKNGATADADVRTRARAALEGRGKLLAMFNAIEASGVLDAAQLAAVSKVDVGNLRFRVQGLVDALEAESIFVITFDSEPLVVRWTGPR